MTTPIATQADLSSLPEWVRRVLTASPSAPAKASITDLKGTPAWPLVVDAAVVSSFLPRELGPRSDDPAAREKAEGDLLDYCVVSHEPQGTRWALTPDARAEVLRSVVDTGDLTEAVTRTAAQFTDGVSAELRQLVQRQSETNLDALDRDTLESLRAAAGLVGDVEVLTPPPLADLDRALELRRLLAQFERITGKTIIASTKTPRADRFFGRDDDLRKLRSFVDVVKSQSLGERLVRGAQRIGHTFIGRNPVAVWGLGGVGKTTLMAKFMLEHAHAAATETRYPFAYLDFDRAAISPRNRAALLIEMALQVGAQFPQISDKLLEIRERARDLSRRMETSSNVDSISRISPLMWEFRNAVDGLLDTLENRFSRPRPFLLVFDTFEVVQYTPSDVVALEEFVRGFTPPSETGTWSRLRLVISGRKEIRRFLGKVEPIELRGLDENGAKDMLQWLAADGALALGERDAKRLIEVIAGIAGGSDQGWRPLRLRLIVQILGQMHEDTPDAPPSALVDRLIAILKDPAQGGAAFIDGILVRRILEHLHDGRVIALADPGLVVRRVTPAVIRHVMAQGTPKPDVSQPNSTIAASNRDDATNFVPWDMSDEEAADIFAAFKREVTLVEGDNDAVWHRQDVRREMLPLIMARKNRFALLHNLAWTYYTNVLKDTPDDRAAAAEAIYHGLWLNQPTTVLDALWPSGASFNPKIDSEEFPPEGESSIFLKLQTGGALTPYEASEIPHDLAVRWLNRRGSALIDEGLTENVRVLRRVYGGDPGVVIDEPVLAANATEALYRAGYWDDAVSLVVQAAKTYAEQEELANLPSLVRQLRVGAMMTAKVGASIDELERAATRTGSVDNATLRIDVALSLGFSARRRRSGTRGDDFIGAAARQFAQVSPAAWRADVRLLRLAILVCGSELLPSLQAIYFDATDGLPRDSDIQSVTQPLTRIDPDLASQITDYLSDRRPTFDQTFREAIIAGVQRNREVAEVMRSVIAFDHRDWKHPFISTLERALVRDRSGILTTCLRNPRLRLSSRIAIDKRADATSARSIIDALLDGGALLEFARSLREIQKQYVDSTGPDPDSETVASGRRPEFPQELFGLGAALLRWHDALVRTVGERGRAS